MLVRGYVCRRCQAKKLKPTAPAAPVVTHRRASYISLSPASLQPAQASNDNYDGVPLPAESPRANHPTANNAGQLQRSSHARRAAPRPSGRYSGAAISLPFEDLYAVPKGVRGSGKEQRQSAGTATQLATLLADPGSLSEAWTYFQQHYPRKDCPALLNPAYQDLRHLQHGRVFLGLLRTLAVAWAASPVQNLPRPSAVIKQFEDLGIWRPEFWVSAAWPVARRLFLFERQKFDGQEVALGELSQELLDWWLMLLRRHCKHVLEPNKTEARLIDWSALQKQAINRTDSLKHSHDFPTRFLHFFQALAPNDSVSLSALALVSSDMFLKDTVISSLPSRDQVDCSGLIRTLLLLMNGRNVGRPAESLRKLLGTFDGAISPVAIDDYVRYVNQMPERARAMLAYADARASKMAQEPEGAATDSEELDPEQDVLQMFSTRIQRAQAQQNSVRLQLVFQHLQASYRTEENGEKRTSIPALLYDQLISAFFALRRGDAALQVWKYMVENGTQPTTKTWTAMVDGANKARDYVAAEGIWQRMLQSDVALDRTAWVVRMTTLVNSRKHKDALAALEDMGRRWVDASHNPGTDTQAVQPSMEMVNAIVGPLAKASNKESLSRVLAWARSLGLKPDVYTYNALIGAAVSKGNGSDADRLLRQMSAQGIEPDVATYSLIFDHILVHTFTAQSLTPQQVQAKAFETLEGLEDQGMKANNYIYSQLVDRLLKHHDNLPAAQAVISYMLKKDLEPSEHAYTSLVTYYFSLDPPDIASVADIVNRLETTFYNVNTYFYDRVLQGYAASDCLPLLTRTLRRMKKEGRAPSWQALQEIALAMERAGEWRLLAELIADAEARESGTLVLEVGKRNMKGVFFRTVARLREQGRVGPDTRERGPT